MRKITIFLLSLLLLSSLCFAGHIQQMHQAVIMKKAAVTPGDMGSIVRTDTRAGSADYAYATNHVPSTAGYVGYIHAYIALGNGDTIGLYIYDASHNVIDYACVTHDTDNAGWLNLALNSGTTLVAATTYRLGICSDGAFTFYHDGAASNGIDYEDYGSSACPQGNIAAWDALDWQTYDICVYVDNNSGSPD